MRASQASVYQPQVAAWILQRNLMGEPGLSEPALRAAWIYSIRVRDHKITDKYD